MPLSLLDGSLIKNASIAIAKIIGLQTALDAKAPLASPIFSGTPLAPTAAAGSNTNQLATTKFVQTGLGGKADTSHTHSIADIGPLGDELSARALAERQVLAGGIATGGGDLTADRTITVHKALGSDLRTGTDDAKAVTSKSVTDALAPVALTDAATINIDMAQGRHFFVTLAGNRALGLPTNIRPGDSGTIRLAQDATGGRTLSYNSVFKFPGGTVPSLSTAANAVDYLSWFAFSSTFIFAVLSKDVK